jgi:hypothetical protein
LYRALARGAGVDTTYGYDGVSRLSSLAQAFNTGSQDLTETFTRNPVGQITQRTATNAAYEWSGVSASADDDYAANQLNQFTDLPGAGTVSYDTNGNRTSDGAATATFNVINQYTGDGTDVLRYDPTGRLVEIDTGDVSNRFAYDGIDAIEEYSTGTWDDDNNAGTPEVAYSRLEGRVACPGLDPGCTAPAWTSPCCGSSTLTPAQTPKR